MGTDEAQATSLEITSDVLNRDGVFSAGPEYANEFNMIVTDWEYGFSATASKQDNDNHTYAEGPLVYILIDERELNNIFLYAGQTKDGKIRFSEHKRKGRQFSKILYFHCPNMSITTNDTTFIETAFKTLIDTLAKAENSNIVAGNKTSPSAPSHSIDSPQVLNSIQIMNIAGIAYSLLRQQLQNEALPWNGAAILTRIVSGDQPEKKIKVGKKEVTAKEIYDDYHSDFPLLWLRWTLKLPDHKQIDNLNENLKRRVRFWQTMTIGAVACFVFVLCGLLRLYS